MQPRAKKTFVGAAACALVLLFLPGSLIVSRGVTSSGSREPLSSGSRAAGVAAAQGVAELLGRGHYHVLAWNHRTGLWGGHTPPNWWESALTISSLVRYVEQSGNDVHTLDRVLARTYARNLYKPGSTAKYKFADEFMDDTGWWGQAWLTASHYELAYRHNLARARRFVSVAAYDARYIATHRRWCGGIEWRLGTPPDTITGAEFVTLAARLSAYLRAPGPLHAPGAAAYWLREARQVLRWLERTGLVDVGAGVVRDRLTGSCHGFVGGPMTYTEGEVTEALLGMSAATGDRAYLRQAARFIRYTISPRSGLTTPDGILREHCEATLNRCADLANREDMPTYKGIFIVAVRDYDRATRRHTFAAFLRRQAQAILAHSVRGPDSSPGNCSEPNTCRFVFSWWGAPAVVGRWRRRALNVTVGSQVSAIDALTAVLPRSGR